MKGFTRHSAIHFYYHNKFTLTTTEDRTSQCLDQIFLSNSDLLSIWYKQNTVLTSEKTIINYYMPVFFFWTMLTTDHL